MDEELVIPESGEGRSLLQQFMAQGGVPSFVARAARVQQTWDAVLTRCRAQREEWLLMVRLRLGRLAALAGDWLALQPWLAAEQLRSLQELHDDLRPTLRVAVTPTTSTRTLRHALAALAETLFRFNARWRVFLDKVDLSAANDARDKYNRYYLLEKECVVRSPHVARRGFTPLPPLTVRDVEAELPLLVMIEMNGE